MPWMVTYHSMDGDGDPPTQGWYPTRRKYTPDSEFGTETLLTKLRPSDNYHGWSPTILWLVTHQPKDGHQTEGSILQTQNLTL